VKLSVSSSVIIIDSLDLIDLSLADLANECDYCIVRGTSGAFFPLIGVTLLDLSLELGVTGFVV